jgi:hypothetical protein
MRNIAGLAPSVLLVLAFFCGIQVINGEEPLKLSGRIINFEVEERNDSVALSINVNLSLRNVSKKPVLLTISSYPASSAYFIPDNSFMSICSRISGVSTTGRDERFLYSSCRLPSIEAPPDWESIRSEFDKSAPPQNRIKVLKSEETFEFPASLLFRFPTKRDLDSVDRDNALWGEIKEAKSLSLQLTYRIWSLELEKRSSRREQRSFGKTLQRRWKKYGYLWLDDIVSERIVLELKTATDRR